MLTYLHLLVAKNFFRTACLCHLRKSHTHCRVGLLVRKLVTLLKMNLMPPKNHEFLGRTFMMSCLGYFPISFFLICLWSPSQAKINCGESSRDELQTKVVYLILKMLFLQYHLNLASLQSKIGLVLALGSRSKS